MTNVTMEKRQKAQNNGGGCTSTPPTRAAVMLLALLRLIAIVFCFFFPVLFLGLDRSKSEAGHRVGDAQNVEQRHQLLFITGRS